MLHLTLSESFFQQNGDKLVSIFCKLNILDCHGHLLCTVSNGQYIILWNPLWQTFQVLNVLSEFNVILD